MIELNFKPILLDKLEVSNALLNENIVATQSLYTRVGFQPPWIAYVALDAGGIAVGLCGFKSPPQVKRVEIAYFTLAEFAGRGIAQSMARHLIRLAKANDPRIQVFAQTLPELNSSNHILKKTGFLFHKIVQHPEDGPAWEWELP